MSGERLLKSAKKAHELIGWFRQMIITGEIKLPEEKRLRDLGWEGDYFIYNELGDAIAKEEENRSAWLLAGRRMRMRGGGK